MNSGNIYASELSTSRHSFMNYHFCRGNSNKRKTRLGIILKGGGTYIYLGRRLKVKEGDLVFIPENIYCYSEWRGEPEIEVVYVSCFMHYDGFEYAPQTVDCDEGVKDTVLKISELLSGGFADGLEAYSLLYEVFKSILPDMKQNAGYEKGGPDHMEPDPHNPAAKQAEEKKNDSGEACVPPLVGAGGELFLCFHGKPPETRFLPL